MSVISLGVVMIRHSAVRRQFLFYGAMTVTLGCGDAFHLILRVMALDD